jgi:hypothetical protein
MAKIEKLTPEQEALIPIVRDEWLKIGLATGPTDRDAAQGAISDAYRMAGLEPPRHWIWLGSPWTSCLVAWMLIKPPNIKALHGCLEKAQSRTEVRQQVWAQLEHEIGASVWEQIRTQVGVPVKDQIEAQIEDPFYGDLTPVKNQASHEVWDLVENQIRKMIFDQVWHRVGDQILAHIWAQAWDLVGDRVKAQAVPEKGHWVGADTDYWILDLVGEFMFGQHEADFLALYDLFRRTGRVQIPERFEPLMRVARNAGWWWPLRRTCIIAERPSRLMRDAGHRLHCADGPALLYPDGWAIHAWHGVRIPAWFVEDKQRITPDAIEAEENAELRRVTLEIFGFDRYIAARGARLIAEDKCLGQPRQLFEIDLKGERVCVLRVVNGTVEADGRQRQFHVGVPLECKTPHEAVAWSYGLAAHRYKEAVRT